jgi:hypothetical protein
LLKNQAIDEKLANLFGRFSPVSSGGTPHKLEKWPFCRRKAGHFYQKSRERLMGEA